MFNDLMHPQDGDKERAVNINVEEIPHHELLETAFVSGMAGTALLADDLTGGGFLDDPIAIGCYFVAEVAATAYISITTIDALKKYSVLLYKPHSQHETKANWDKHSGRRAGKQYNINQNNKKAKKIELIKLPPILTRSRNHTKRSKYLCMTNLQNT